MVCERVGWLDVGLLVVPVDRQDVLERQVLECPSTNDGVANAAMRPPIGRTSALSRASTRYRRSPPTPMMAGNAVLAVRAASTIGRAWSKARCHLVPSRRERADQAVHGKGCDETIGLLDGCRQFLGLRTIAGDEPRDRGEAVRSRSTVACRDVSIELGGDRSAVVGHRSGGIHQGRHGVELLTEWRHHPQQVDEWSRAPVCPGNGSAQHLPARGGPTTLAAWSAVSENPAPSTTLATSVNADLVA